MAASQGIRFTPAGIPASAPAQDVQLGAVSPRGWMKETQAHQARAMLDLARRILRRRSPAHHENDVHDLLPSAASRQFPATLDGTAALASGTPSASSNLEQKTTAPSDKCVCFQCFNLPSTFSKEVGGNKGGNRRHRGKGTFGLRGPASRAGARVSTDTPPTTRRGSCEAIATGSSSEDPAQHFRQRAELPTITRLQKMLNTFAAEDSK